MKIVFLFSQRLCWSPSSVLGWRRKMRCQMSSEERPSISSIVCGAMGSMGMGMVPMQSFSSCRRRTLGCPVFSQGRVGNVEHHLPRRHL